MILMIKNEYYNDIFILALQTQIIELLTDVGHGAPWLVYLITVLIHTWQLILNLMKKMTKF